MVPNTFVENLKTSTDMLLSPIGKYGHSPRCALSQYLRPLLILRLVNQLSIHALGIPGSVPKHMRGILDVISLVTQLCVSQSPAQFDPGPTHSLTLKVLVKMCNRIAIR